MTSTLPLDVTEDIRNEDDFENPLNKINTTDSTDNADYSKLQWTAPYYHWRQTKSGESLIAVKPGEYGIEDEAFTTIRPLIIPPNEKNRNVVTNVNRQIMAFMETPHQNLKKTGQGNYISFRCNTSSNRNW